MISRKQSDSILKMAKSYPVVTITGPRQSGKTTLARALFPQHEYRNLEAEDILEIARSDPRAFLNQGERDMVIDKSISRRRDSCPISLAFGMRRSFIRIRWSETSSRTWWWWSKPSSTGSIRGSNRTAGSTATRPARSRSIFCLRMAASFIRERSGVRPPFSSDMREHLETFSRLASNVARSLVVYSGETHTDVAVNFADVSDWCR